MKSLLAKNWNVLMDSRFNPLRHMDLASQHVYMQVLGWMWSMVFSISYLSISQFGIVWIPHMLIIGGFCFTAALFKESEKMALKAVPVRLQRKNSTCLWDLEKEAEHYRHGAFPIGWAIFLRYF